MVDEWPTEYPSTYVQFPTQVTKDTPMTDPTPAPKPPEFCDKCNSERQFDSHHPDCPNASPTPTEGYTSILDWIIDATEGHEHEDTYAARAEYVALRARCETAERERDSAKALLGASVREGVIGLALRERDEARAEMERLKAYVGGQMLRSDYRTADEMRAALDAALAEADRLKGATA